ncbi:lipopolysaccharide biosynthesis protein [Streptomyces verrucosisporus]|uniref:lipopolysaccharide biosynthesis protein n=1 Tax=Streptomyces verrucosisporus TaxID=1695161 RepID=UPI0019D15F5C|nr:lipopolysaccharide biosynthesis protein [Streptomyces verrucosisporus]MBN3931266.1 lipopolysaccharide biosynthesis protein [Streptomyces verrucosisporus]
MSAYDPSSREPDQLRDQLRRLLRHRAVIAAGLLLGAACGGAVSTLGGADYTATGEVVVQAISTAPFEAGGVSADKQISMGTERQVARSATVAGRAAGELGGGADPAQLQRGLRVSNPPDTHILEFEYTADSPQAAAERVNAFVSAYLDHREAAVVRRIDNTVAELNEELQPLIDQREELDEKIAGASTESARQTAESERANLAARIADLQGRVTGLKTLDTSPGDVVRRGEAPEVPSGPGTAVLVPVGAVAGLAGGLLAAWIRSLLDPRARSAGEVRTALRAPVLGILPPPRRDGAGILEVGPSHGGERAEEFRTIALRTLRHPRLAEPGGLLVVSAREHPGTLPAAVNLAAALAETGRDVLLVEADPRTPRLAGELPVRGAVREPVPGRWPDGARATVDAGTAGYLELIPGCRVPDAARALNSPGFTGLLSGAAERGEYVVAVTAPLLSHADGTAVAGLARGVLVVCDPDTTLRDDLDRVRDLVASVGGHVLGAVLYEGGRRRRRIPSPAAPTESAPSAEPGPPAGTGRSGADTGPGAGTGGGPGGTGEDTVALKRLEPEPPEARPDTAYGSYGRYRRTGDGTTPRP